MPKPRNPLPSLTIVMAIALGLLAGEGCAMRGLICNQPPATSTKTTPGSRATSKPSGKQKSGFPWNLFHRPPPPPRARILLEAGSIRSVSPDGSYAIIELAPGNAIPVGEILLAPSPSHTIARLKVTEIQGTFLAAEITEGTVSPGDIVKH